MDTELRATFCYDPDSGAVLRRMFRGRPCAPRPCGSLHSSGYLYINHHGRVILVHRLAWFLHTGQWPATNIDHEDLNRANNRWSNLRIADDCENGWNKSHNSNSSLGIKGVSPDRNGFRASVGYRGETHQSWHSTIEAAQQWAIAKRNELHGDFANH